MIAVTGATGQLGQLVIAALVERGAKPSDIVAVVRDPAKAAGLAQRGIKVRKADYNDPAELAAALKGVGKLLLISSSVVGARAKQHGHVIAAASHAGVKLVAYTSILRAPSSPMILAGEHQETEKMLADSGLPHVLLRNGWYTENYLMGLAPALEHGAVLGAAGDGRISAAGRADYAAAAAAVLLSPEPQAGRIYELAGDTSFTLGDLAAAITKLSGKSIVYRNLPQADLVAALAGSGLPAAYAHILADCDAAIAKGALEENGKALSSLTGKPTASLESVLSRAMA